MESQLDEDFRRGGFMSQLTKKAGDNEDDIRDHDSVNHDNIPFNGWIPDVNTWTWVSTDGPTFVISVDEDMTTVVSVGMRVWLNHLGIDKYFIITAVGGYSGTATNVTLYGGTSYTLNNTAITLPYFSPCKSPLGFPMDPSSWTESVTDATNQSQATPTANTWYNLGGFQLSIPIGSWNVYYQCVAEVITTTAAVTSLTVRATLSGANNTNSNSDFATGIEVPFPIVVAGVMRSSLQNSAKNIIQTVKKTFFLNCLTSVNATSISFRGDGGAGMTSIRAVCAYL